MKNFLQAAAATLALSAVSLESEAQVQRTLTIRSNPPTHSITKEDSTRAQIMDAISQDLQKLAAKNGYTVTVQEPATSRETFKGPVFDPEDVGFRFDLIKVYTGNKFSYDDYPNADGSYYARETNKGDKLIFVNRTTKKTREKQF